MSAWVFEKLNKSICSTSHFHKAFQKNEVEREIVCVLGVGGSSLPSSHHCPWIALPKVFVNLCLCTAILVSDEGKLPVNYNLQFFFQYRAVRMKLCCGHLIWRALILACKGPVVRKQLGSFVKLIKFY